MFTRLTDLTKAFLYYTIASGLCLGLTLLAPVLGPRITEAVMFTPMVAVLLMLLVVTRDGCSSRAWQALGLHRLGLQGWTLALLVPLFVLTFSYGIVWLTGMASLIPPSTLSGIPSYLMDVFLSIAIVTVLGGIGEEIGWRGYLLPKLRALGLRRAMVLTGLLHGLWHLPVILGTSFYHGAGNRLIVIPMFLLTLIAAGICYGYLRFTTASVWPPALAHGTFNILWDRFNMATLPDSPLTVEYLSGESGLLTLIGLSMTAGWLLYRLRIDLVDVGSAQRPPVSPADLPAPGAH